MKLATLIAVALLIDSQAGMTQSISDAVQSARELSVRDCQIWAALGQQRLRWGTERPNPSTFAIFYRPLGSSYVEQCPWKSLGVIPLPLGMPDLNNMQFFTLPSYQSDNVVEVNIITKISSPATDGQHVSPFMAGETCTLRKHNRNWRLVSCRDSFIT